MTAEMEKIIFVNKAKTLFPYNQKAPHLYFEIQYVVPYFFAFLLGDSLCLLSIFFNTKHIQARSSSVSLMENYGYLGNTAGLPMGWGMDQKKSG